MDEAAYLGSPVEEAVYLAPSGRSYLPEAARKKLFSEDTWMKQLT
jgi:hypothetical protein